MSELSMPEAYEVEHERGERVMGWLAALVWSVALQVALWMLLRGWF